MKPTKILIGALAAAFCFGQQSTTANQDTKTNQSRSSETSAQKDRAGMTGKQADLSRTAAEMLRHVNQARQAIEQDNRNEALKHVKQARSAFDNLDQTMSAESSKIVPIYEELESVSIIGPIRTAKQTSQEQESEQQSEKSSADRSAGRSAAQEDQTPAQAPAVQQMAAEYTIVALDTAAVKPHLEAVEAALEQGNLRQADAGLKTIQSGVTLASVASDLPLLRARRNLALAHQMASEGKSEQAAAPLKEAAEALSTYATTITGTRAAEANRMRDEIREFAGNIGQQEDAANRISQWWDRTTEWTATQPQQ